MDNVLRSHFSINAMQHNITYMFKCTLTNQTNRGKICRYSSVARTQQALNT